MISHIISGSVFLFTPEKPMGILVKALIGALVVVLIGLLAKSRSYYIAGLVPLFPTFALIAHYIVGSERSIEALRTTLIFGMWAVLPYLVYLISLYLFINSMRLSWALSAAVLCWIAAAWLLITLWGWWQGR
ncbi:inner membrane protein YdgC [Serratia plymuthica 4Rx13]|nr:inner membrane protein YdgC [Serratia plymuthica 4Rx13]